MTNRERQRKHNHPKRVTALLLAAIMALGGYGCASGGAGSDSDVQTQTNADPGVQAPVASSANLYCLEFNSFSGVFVEDGKNEEVKDVAAILVENRSELFLDRATITYKYGDKTATFLVTGLPAGKKCWVMEANKMKLDKKHTFEFEDCVSAFKDDAVLFTDKLTTQTEDNKVTVRNISEETLENVCVYYKDTMGDGNYFGGITYVMNFETLEPGESLTKESGHYSDTSMIVRFSFQAK